MRQIKITPSMETLSEALPQTALARNGMRRPVRHIRKVAVLGSGVMGSQIALLLAGIGLDVLLLDIIPTD
ncbi:MAG: 3-hydroxyacyl-CoA dehydrogenase NAD-binding domain-containing protein, partial [Flavobacteriales bacterium]|nr:3-hydroxyacyl-CoA dehydrogenase NAD-binding domain-containing protein [Flavobacteriales bacterium]MDW8410915.1 3-hydroxyacyl-CoA dehydrogenase NAD-binding domain-containing protein [Flavobacteriales bacterium]